MPVDSTLVCVNDFEKFAQRNTTKQSWDYFKSGANHEQTLEDNRLAFKRLVSLSFEKLKYFE